MVEVWAFAMVVAYGPESAGLTLSNFMSETECEITRHEFIDLQVHPREGELEVMDVGPCERVEKPRRPEEIGLDKPARTGIGWLDDPARFRATLDEAGILTPPTHSP